MKSLVAYKQIRDQIKTGDMLEWRSRSALGYVIRFFSGENKNHTGKAFVFDNYGNCEGNHIFTLEAEPDGIENNLLSAQLEKFDGEVYWSPLKPEFDHLRHKGIDWALQCVGTPYDFKSLFKQALVKVSADARKFFCSEYYFIYLVICGILPQFTFDTGRKVVVDSVTGKEVIAPKPGEFDKFKIHLFTRQIL
jgi:uncharacterized protein YycO